MQRIYKNKYRQIFFFNLEIFVMFLINLIFPCHKKSFIFLSPKKKFIHNKSETQKLCRISTHIKLPVLDISILFFFFKVWLISLAELLVSVY